MDDIELSIHLENWLSERGDNFSCEDVEELIKFLGKERSQTKTKIEIKGVLVELKELERYTERKRKDMRLILKNYIYVLQNKERVSKLKK